MSEQEQQTHRLLPERVDLGNFASERAAGEAWLAAAAAGGGRNLTLDLSSVTSASSLLVALLLAWLRHARALGVRLEFVAVPETVQAIVDFSGLETLLPVAEPGRDPSSDREPRPASAPQNQQENEQQGEPS